MDAFNIDRTTCVVATVIGSYFAWRIWRFTIEPAMHPEKPQPLPYSIPFVGHIFSYFADGEGLITRGRQLRRNSREPFALTMFGSTIYVFVSAIDMATIWKKTAELTFDAYVHDLMVQIGISPDGMRRITNYQGSSGVLPNPSQKPFMELKDSFFKHQLHRGAEFDKLQDVVLEKMSEEMTWEKTARSPKMVLSTSQDGMTVSLLTWIQSVLVEGVTRAFFGNALLDKIDPGVTEGFSNFDDQSWKLVYRLPPPWSTPMLAAQARVKNALTRYFELPREERSDASWIVLGFEDEMRAQGIQNQDIAAILFLTFWVINGNAWKLAFWMLTYLLFDAQLYATVRAEARDALALSTSLSDLAKRLDKCAALGSVYHETLRLATASIAVRNVAQPTVVGGKALQPGARLIIPLRQILTDQEAFGADALAFDGARFLRNPKLLRSPSFKPFGGGETYCPGRFLARAEVLTCVALALGRFELRLAAGEAAAFPRMEGKVPCIGIMKPVDGQDVVVRLRPASP